MNTKKSFKIIVKVYKLIFSFTDRNTEFETIKDMGFFKPANVKTSSIKI